MNPYSVLLKPQLSEKSDLSRESHNKYSFLVKQDASKTDVKNAIEKLFDVKVASVNTCITRGKYRRRGMHISLGKKKKRAVVTLLEGQKISVFEG